VGHLFRAILRPLTRFIVGLIAIPLFRLILKKGIRLQDIDEELEKDLEQWFRGSLLLLAATANLEDALYGWLPIAGGEWLKIGFRLLLAVSVIEAMPDQELFAIIHPGPPHLKVGKGLLREAWQKKRALFKGIVCQHLNRSSPVFAIMAAIFGGEALVNVVDPVTRNAVINPETGNVVQQTNTLWVVGWTCYGIAIVQYLIIGLVTSRDKALDVLGAFDQQVAIRRREIIDEFDLVDRPAETGDSPETEATKAAQPQKNEVPVEETPNPIVAKEPDPGYVSE